MDYLIILPIFIVFLYGVQRLHSNTNNKTILLLVLIPIIMIGIYFTFKNSLHISDLLILLLVTETGVIFLVLCICNKTTILLTLLFVLSIGLITFIGLKYEEVTIYLSFLITLMFLLTESNQLFIRKTYEEAATEYQNKILDKQVEEVKNIYITMRGWRHDYHNHLQKLKAHIMMDQINEASRYLNELEIDLDSVDKLVESGNINLDAILNSKISLALKENISINFKANVPKKLVVSDIDLCILIGNLIDNAVEACYKKQAESTKFIRIYIGAFKKQLYITVSNSTNEIIRKLDEEYISTKRGNHGHGLKRINNIIDKYDGYINRQNEPGVFVTEVLLPL